MINREVIKTLKDLFYQSVKHCKHMKRQLQYQLKFT